LNFFMVAEAFLFAVVVTHFIKVYQGVGSSATLGTRDVIRGPESVIVAFPCLPRFLSTKMHQKPTCVRYFCLFRSINPKNGLYLGKSTHFGAKRGLESYTSRFLMQNDSSKSFLCVTGGRFVSHMRGGAEQEVDSLAVSLVHAQTSTVQKMRSEKAPKNETFARLW